MCKTVIRLWWKEHPVNTLRCQRSDVTLVSVRVVCFFEISFQASSWATCVLRDWPLSVQSHLFYEQEENLKAGRKSRITRLSMHQFPLRMSLPQHFFTQQKDFVLKSSKLNFICSSVFNDLQIEYFKHEMSLFQEGLVPSYLSDSSWFFYPAFSHD